MNEARKKQRVDMYDAQNERRATEVGEDGLTVNQRRTKRDSQRCRDRKVQGTWHRTQSGAWKRWLRFTLWLSYVVIQ